MIRRDGLRSQKVHAVDRSFSGPTSSSTETPPYSQTMRHPLPSKPTVVPGVTKPSKPMQKSRPAASPPKRPRSTKVFKTDAMSSTEVGEKSSVKVVRAKNPRAGGGNDSGSTSKSSAGAKGGTTIEIEGSKIILRKVGGAVTTAGDVKQETDVMEIPPTEAKVKATGVTKRKTNKPLVGGQPRWTVTKPQAVSWKTEPLSSRIPTSESKPEVWASSREELLSALPELAKPTNGIAWLMAEAPVLILEDREIGLSVFNVPSDGVPSMELIMARDFECMPADLFPPPPDLPTSTRDVGVPRRGTKSSPKKTLNVSSGNVPGDASALEPQKSPKHPRTLPASPRKTNQGVYIVNSVKATKVEQIEYNFGMLYTMPPEPNEGPLAATESEVTNYTPTATQPDYHRSNADAHSGMSGAFNHTSHSCLAPRAPEQAPSQGSASTSTLKRGPGARDQSAEVPSKRIKVEPIETSLWDSDIPGLTFRQSQQALSIDKKSLETSLPESSIPGLTIQQSQQGLPIDGKRNTDQVVRGHPRTATQRSSALGSSKTDVSTPLVRPTSSSLPRRRDTDRKVAIPKPLPAVPPQPRPHVSSSSTTNLQQVTERFKPLPAGLSFKKQKPKVEPQESAVPVQNGQDLPKLSFTQQPKVEPQESSVPRKNGQGLLKPLVTPPLDLLFGQPAHQRPITIKDEAQDMVIPSGRRIPFTLPPEVQVMLDSYVSGRAVVVIASNAVLRGRWNISLPREYAYAYLGFFRVRRVWETLVADSKGLDGHLAGQVEWRFRCDWGPSADDVANSELSRCVPQPWWVPGPRRIDKGKVRAKAEDDEGMDPDTDTESSIQYRISRQKHPNYWHRRTALNESYQCVLPRHVRVPDTLNMPDEAFSLGWPCKDCGKLNYRAMLRHRKCTSSFCKEKPPPLGYALSLEQLREPQQGSPISHPYDAYPQGVEAYVAVWGDQMRTYTYVVAGTKEEGITIKHIFTSNSEALQMEATKLLELFQLDIPMQRKIGKATIPYFECVIESTPGAAKSPTMTWNSSPPCATWAEETMLYHAQCYGEKPNFDFNKLSVLAWITSGTRKGPSSLQCKANSIIIMCLGADTVISATPKSGFPNHIGRSAIGPSAAMLVDDDSHLDPASREEDDPMPDGDLGAEADITSPAAPKPARVSGKPPKPAISTTLVHGDAVILSGDDFEYSVKRSGTSILLIGSYVTT